jgi:Fe-S oxidoreductase
MSGPSEARAASNAQLISVDELTKAPRASGLPPDPLPDLDASTPAPGQTPEDRESLGLSPTTRRLDFFHEAYSAMNGCLGCKACASDCPLQSHTPELKPQFVELHHRHRPRRFGDHLVAWFEVAMTWMGRAPAISNLLLGSRLFRWSMSRFVALEGIPLLSRPTLKSGLRSRGTSTFLPKALAELDPETRERAVLLVQDVFTSFLDPEVVLTVHDLLRVLGYEVRLLSYRPNGQALRLKGFAEHHRRVAERNEAFLSEAAATGVPLVGIDPAATLSYRSKGDGDEGRGFEVLLLQEWMEREQERILAALDRSGYVRPGTERFWLLPHCSERDASPGSQELWQRMFALFGLDLELIGSGCCRRRATEGCEIHEAGTTPSEDADWHALVPEGADGDRRYLATSYACRRHIASSEGPAPRHPAQVLLDALRAGRAQDAAPDLRS